MNIITKINEQEYTLNLNKNTILFGQDNTFKTTLINNLINCLNNKNKNILIDGNKYDYKNYNIIYINEESDLADDFKFTKNNPLKQLIYEDIISKKNSEKIINYTNEIFDTIDNKVNNLLNKNINKKSDNNISFQIEIPDINSIIDKFTNIYIDNILLSSDNLTKSVKRKLLYQLYFMNIKSNNDKTNIIIIDNFDVYLSSNEIINFINNINKLSNENCHFILTSSSNIFEYIPVDNFSIYKVTDKLINFNQINEAIKIYLLKKEFEYKKDTNFSSFYSENEHLILQEEIEFIKDKIINSYPHLISKILNCDNIQITAKRPKNITNEYIICENNELKKLFQEIYKQFID